MHTIVRFHLNILFVFFLLFLVHTSLPAQDIRMYIFGHSLLDHRPPMIPTPSDETTVPFWVDQIAKHGSQSYAVGGQYGFLTSHDDLPPIAQWGYDSVAVVWYDENETFAEANINTIMVTAANFIWDIPAHEPHPFDGQTSVVQSTSTIFDWVEMQGDEANFYIYGNWPEMNLPNDFPPTPPTPSEIENFHNTTTGPFADWWLNYHDSILVSHPHTRLIPVGPTIARLLRDRLDSLIPFPELYEDAAPHGRASMYFLAGMITYMAVYQENIPQSYQPGAIIHETIRDSFPMIRDFFWSELNDFNFANGESRVFLPNSTAVDNIALEENAIHFYPNPSRGQLKVSGDFSNYNIEILDSMGQHHLTVDTTTSEQIIDLNTIPDGLYFIQVRNQSHQLLCVRRIIKTE